MLGRQTDGNQKKKKRSTGKNAVLGNTKMAYIYILPVFIFLGVFTYYAMAFNIGISFDNWNGVSPEKIFVGLDNYMKLMKDPYFHLALKNTTVYFLITIPVQAVLGFLLANCFVNTKVRAKGLIRSIIFFPNVVALVVIGTAFNQMYNFQQGFLNETLRAIGLGKLALDWTGNPKIALYSIIIANIYTYVGFSMTLYITGLLSVPKDVMEAAKIDGASGVQSTRYIALPLLKSTHTTVILLGIVGTLKTFDIVWLITQGGPARKTEMLTTMLYRSYILEYKAGYAAAIAVVILIIALVLSCINLYFQRKDTDY